MPVALHVPGPLGVRHLPMLRRLTTVYLVGPSEAAPALVALGLDVREGPPPPDASEVRLEPLARWEPALGEHPKDAARRISRLTHAQAVELLAILAPGAAPLPGLGDVRAQVCEAYFAR